MNRQPIRQRVFLLIAAGLLCFALSLFATDYEGPPPTTPDYGAVWTGPFLSNDPFEFDTYDADLIYASNDHWYSATWGDCYDNEERLRLGISISKFDRYGNCIIMDRMIYDYEFSQFFFYWYEDPGDELWLTGISGHNIFYVVYVNENGDPDVQGLFTPLPDEYMSTEFLSPVFTDSLGYPNVLLLKRIGQPGEYQEIVTLYKFEQDFSRVMCEYEYPDLLADDDHGGTAVVGPGDTLHVVYSRQIGDDPESIRHPLYYSKIGFEGEIYYGPVTHTDLSSYISINARREQTQLVVDNQNNVYIICQHFYSAADRRAFLHIYRNDGTIYQLDFTALTGNITPTGQTLTLDCMGRVHLFWTMNYNNNNDRGIGHAAVTNGSRQWVIEPHYLQIEEGWTPSLRYDAASSPSEYRICMVNSTTTYQDWDNTHMWLLGRPEEPDTSESHSFLDRDNLFIEPSFSPQIFPNPFNSSTTVRYYAEYSGPALISIFDVLGREVAILLDRPVTAGWHTVPFHCRSGTLPSGTYFVRIETHEASPTITQITYAK